MKIKAQHTQTWDTMKAVLKGKLITLSAFIKELENYHSSTSESSRTKRRKCTKRSRSHETIKLRDKIDKLQTKRTLQITNETENWLFEKINKIDKLLAKLSKRESESTQINKIRNEKGDIIINTEESQRIIRSYFKGPYFKKLENLKEMDDFLDISLTKVK